MSGSSFMGFKQFTWILVYNDFLSNKRLDVSQVEINRKKPANSENQVKISRSCHSNRISQCNR